MGIETALQHFLLKQAGNQGHLERLPEVTVASPVLPGGNRGNPGNLENTHGTHSGKSLTGLLNNYDCLLKR